MRTALLLLLLACGPALAQVSYSAGMVSDYRYRGISLSGEQAALQAGVNADLDAGLYAGAALTRVRFDYTGSNIMGSAYAGMARRLGEQWSVDGGVSAVRFNGIGNYDYREVYAGLSRGRLGMRVSVSPRYFGVGGRTVYVELNGSEAITPEIDLVFHAGYLDPQARRWAYVPPARSDFRVGLSAGFDAWTVQLAWSATRDRAALYPGAPESHAKRAVLGVIRTF